MKEYKNEILNRFNKNEKNVWECVCNLDGLVLRGQLIILLNIVYEIDEIAASKAVSGLKKMKLLESKAAMPGTNAVMIRLTRYGKALLAKKDTKEVTALTDTAQNNLRCIFRVEHIIGRISGIGVKQKKIEALERFHNNMSYLNKNRYKGLYAYCQNKFEEIFHMPDLKHKCEGSILFDNFNLLNMMGREFNLSSIGQKENKIEVVSTYFSVNGTSSKLKIANFNRNAIYIYYMLMRCFYKKVMNDLEIDLTIEIFAFDKIEENFLIKKLSTKNLLQSLRLKNIFVDENAIKFKITNYKLDEKYKLRRLF